MANNVFDPGAVSFLVNLIPMTNLADDNAISVSFNESLATMKIGVDGEAVITMNRNASAKLTVRLMQTSPSNDILMAVVTAFKLKKTLIPIAIKDLTGRSLFACEAAFPDKIPDWGVPKEAGINEWVFNTGKLTAFVGGNG